MALSNLMTQALLPRLKPGMRIASFGYPDMIAPLDYFEGVDLRSIEYRKDSEAICKRHGIPFHGIPDAHSVFESKDCKLDVFDIVKERGCEILCDLNEYANYGPDYDIALDVGTTEHCFNIAQAARNMASMLKAGGIILHENPANWLNHGFYSLNPTWYADWYGQDGWKLLDLKLQCRDGRVYDVPRTQRFVFKDGEANVFAMAERTSILPLTWPCQSKYRQKGTNG